MPSGRSLPMYALLYRSRAQPRLLASDLNAIISEAQARNPERGVTGLLLHGRMEAIPSVSGEFVQWIEGPEAEVESLFQSIEVDPRHFEVEVLGRGAVEDLVGTVHGLVVPVEGGRLFPSWSLGLVQLSELPATLSGFLLFASSWNRQPLDRAA